MDRRLLNALLFILLSIIWGSSFILIKVGLQSLDAFQLASVRILSAGLVLLPAGWRGLRTVPRGKRRLVALSGVLGTFIPAYLFCIAETRINSSLAGILNALTPLFTLAIGVLLFGQPASWRNWVGVAVGFAGLTLLILSGGETIDIDHLGYASLVLLATLCYGLNVNMVNRHLQGVGSLEIAAVAFSLLAAPALLVLWGTGYFNAARWTNALAGCRGAADLLAQPATADGILRSTAAGALLGIVGTAFASVMFYRLLKSAGPLMASMVTYGIPFVAIFWGGMAGEGIDGMQVVGLLIILAGVYLANGLSEKS